MTNYYKIDDQYDLELGLTYQLGGQNFGTMKHEARGIYLHIDVVELSEGCVKRQLFGSLDGHTKSGKILLKELKRKSQKQLTNMLTRLDLDAISTLWINGKYELAFNLIKEQAKD